MVINAKEPNAESESLRMLANSAFKGPVTLALNLTDSLTKQDIHQPQFVDKEMDIFILQVPIDWIQYIVLISLESINFDYTHWKVDQIYYSGFPAKNTSMIPDIRIGKKTLGYPHEDSLTLSCGTSKSEFRF